MGANRIVIGPATRLLPVTTVCADATGQLNRKFPTVRASQNDRCVMIDGEANDHDDHVGELDADLDPADAAFQVTETLGTEAMVFAVPAEPGSPVWGRTNDPAGAVNAVPEIMSSHLFASVVAASPAVTRRTPCRSHGRPR